MIDCNKCDGKGGWVIVEGIACDETDETETCHVCHGEGVIPCDVCQETATTIIDGVPLCDTCSQSSS